MGPCGRDCNLKSEPEGQTQIRHLLSVYQTSRHTLHMHTIPHTYTGAHTQHESMNACTRTPIHTIFGWSSESVKQKKMPFFLCFRQSLQFPLEETVSVLCLVTDFSDYHEQVTKIVFHLFNRTWRWDTDGCLWAEAAMPSGNHSGIQDGW